MKVLFKITVVALFAYGCQGNTNHDLIDIESEVLKKYVESVEIYEINLDHIETTEIELTDDNVIYTIHQTTVNNGAPLLGHINLAEKFQNTFFVYDIPTTGMYAIDKTGKAEGPIMRTGQGPNEHGSISSLKANTEYLYAIDRGNAKIHRLTHSFNNEEPISNVYFNDIDLNDEYFLRQGSSNDDHVLIVSPLHNLQDTTATLLPKLVPMGYQPRVFNMAKFSINNENDILASYLPLPWLFIYNKGFSLEQVVVLNYAAFDSLDIAEFKLEKPKPGERYGGQNPIHNFKLMDNGDIYVGLRNEIIELKLDRNGKYFLSKKISFKNSFNVASSYWTWVFSEIFAKEEDTLYVRNPQYLFQFVMPD